MNEEIRQAVLSFFESKKLKKRFPIKDIVTELSAFDKREVKATVIEMTDADDIKVWSSGSSSYYMLPAEYDILIASDSETQE